MYLWMYVMNEKISLRTWPIGDLKHTLITWHMETSYPTFQQTNTSIHQLVSFNYMFLFIIGNFAFWLYWCRWQSKIIPYVWNVFKVTNVSVIDKCNYSFHCFNPSRFIELLSLLSPSKQIFVYLFPLNQTKTCKRSTKTLKKFQSFAKILIRKTIVNVICFYLSDIF